MTPIDAFGMQALVLGLVATSPSWYPFTPTLVDVFLWFLQQLSRRSVSSFPDAGDVLISNESAKNADFFDILFIVIAFT
jgi:hypothetical protein